MTGYGYEGMAFMWLPMLIFTALAIATVAAIIVIALKLGPGRHTPASTSESARRILDDRYARGEIDHDEYSKRRDLLG